ncbi:hypothetical protein F383_35358 [Gossypium arboreum]|uniref:Uncharacterized protein n=1 Tax=Gossypium arboreum TaxID=29729 RepID=A0A0B0PV89_GOSAR|nr:hypothetical protein F383_35358 [Gossypium arboreum]
MTMWVNGQAMRIVKALGQHPRKTRVCEQPCHLLDLVRFVPF